MTAKQIVKTIIGLRGFTYQKLAEVLGYTTASGVANRFNTKTTKDMSVDTLVKFLAPLNCEVVIRSTLKDKTEWVITASEEQ